MIDRNKFRICCNLVFRNITKRSGKVTELFIKSRMNFQSSTSCFLHCNLTPLKRKCNFTLLNTAVAVFHGCSCVPRLRSVTIYVILMLADHFYMIKSKQPLEKKKTFQKSSNLKTPQAVNGGSPWVVWP